MLLLIGSVSVCCKDWQRKPEGLLAQQLPGLPLRNLWQWGQVPQLSLKHLQEVQAVPEHSDAVQLDLAFQMTTQTRLFVFHVNISLATLDHCSLKQKSKKGYIFSKNYHFCRWIANDGFQICWKLTLQRWFPLSSLKPRFPASLLICLLRSLSGWVAEDTAFPRLGIPVLLVAAAA